MSVTGLSRRHQRVARNLTRLACARLLAQPENVHYTESGTRWDGIAHRKGIWKAGFWPYVGDCSSTATWVLWRALWIAFRVRDVVNGLDWRAGYTGTQLQHGRRVYLPRVGDLAHYPGHVAVVMSVRPGKILVMSHGSEGGPYLLPHNYRGDFVQFRRYI